MKRSLYILLIVLSALVLTTCKKRPEVKVYNLELTEETVTVTPSSATITANYSYPGDIPQIKVCWSTDSDMSAALETNAVLDNNTMTIIINHLFANTKYYYRFRYSNGINLIDTDIKSFVTENTTAVIPTVVTNSITDITANSAVSGGSITDDGGAEIIEKGVCWGTNQNPTINDYHTSDGTGAGNFTSNITGLNSSTTYYVRAYASNEAGTAYGSEKTLTTLNGGGIAGLPVVVTNEVIEITPHTALCGGNVMSDGGTAVTSRGICWSTNANPTIMDSNTSSGSGTGNYTTVVSSLVPNTTYHVRAYATNATGTAYGLEKTFTTLLGGGGDMPTGAINGLFTINSYGDQVYFSKGNLQYQASTNTWRFAEHQWDYVGGTIDGDVYGTVYENGVKCDNLLISQTYDGWIDLFGWATSGWNNNNLYYRPWNIESSESVLNGYGYGYWDGEATQYDMTGDYANMDWGVYNAISNGGNEPGLWRTFGMELSYIIANRQHATYLHSIGTVNGVQGMILLPDTWILPSGVTFTGSAINFDVNTYNIDEWIIMENAGAVFLPKGGYRNGLSYYTWAGNYGCYWMNYADYGGYSHAWGGTGSVQNRYYGYSVRLIHYNY